MTIAGSRDRRLRGEDYYDNEEERDPRREEREREERETAERLRQHRAREERFRPSGLVEEDREMISEYSLS